MTLLRRYGTGYILYRDMTSKRLLYSTFRVELPTFVIMLIRERAKKTGKPVSSVVETLILDTIFLAEVEDMCEKSRHFASFATEWMNHAVRERSRQRSRKPRGADHRVPLEP